jgi:hypothetical protein
VREGYPCSLADVPQAVRDSSLAALQDAYDALAAGDLTDARALLESRPDVVEVILGDEAIRFRLEGGGPVWLIDVTDDLSPAPMVPTTGDGPASVVGEDTDNDGKVNNRDAKRAFVMSPYKWQFGYWDQSTFLVSLLGSLPAYDGNVKYVANPDENDQNITLADWRSWDQYDAVFVNTHGGRISHGDHYHVLLSSGVRADVSAKPPASTGLWYMAIRDTALKQSNAVVEYGLASDFFRIAYSPGLDNAFVNFKSCKTGGPGASEFAGALGSNDFVMMGWSETVSSSVSAKGLGALIESMALGVRVEEALDRLREEGLDRATNSHGKTTVYTRLAPGGGDQRLIEVPTILDDGGEALADGTDLSGSLDGVAGDGAPDVLTLSTRLAGVVEGTEQQYGVRFELDGDEVGTGYGLTLATRLDENTVEVEYDVELGRDAPVDPAELEAIVQLPEGGESRYAARVNLGSDCGWTMIFAGPDHGGSYEGGLSLVQRGPPTTIFLGDNPAGPSFPSVTIFFPERLPTEVPATLKIGLSGSANPQDQDGVMEIGFEDVVYNSGDGSPCCTPTDPQDTYTPALTMILEENTPERVKGSISGQVWAFGIDGGVPLRKATVEINFDLSNGGDCRISDPYNPKTAQF